MTASWGSPSDRLRERRVARGTTIADRHGKLETPAATHQLVHEVDALQYQFRQGPCVDAVVDAGRHDQTI